MGLWHDQLLPRFTDKALASDDVASVRAEATSGLSGAIVELGFGSGLNVRHYPPDVRNVHAVEPSEVARRLAQPRLSQTKATVTFDGLDGESLPYDDGSLDGALCTFTLCTIPHADVALREVLRVLKPGGRLHFAEHGLSPDESTARWQRRLTPVQRRVFGGCRLDRAIDDLVTSAGLELESLRNDELPGPRFMAPWGYLYIGVARKPPAAA